LLFQRSGENMTDDGFRLYARPSFFEGLARIWDPAGILNQYNRSKTAKDADRKAIAQDWAVVGKDIRSVVSDVKTKKIQSK